jgi:GNAT superfamily N-acetyltransferase
MRAAPHTWLLRVELDDHPGALARLTTRLAARDCNVLGLSVLPVQGGVVDELVVHTPDELAPATLVAEIRAEGGRCVGLTPADVHDLVDTTTAALRAVAAALRDPAAVPEAVRTLLAADSASFDEAAEEDKAEENGHQVVLDAGTPLVARRGWAPFTEVELARAAAFDEVLSAASMRANAPAAVLTTDGAGLVLRRGTPEDAQAVAMLHARCSAQTLFARYHAGMRTLPRRLLHRLLTPPRGSTVLALCGTDVVGLAQLIRTTSPAEAEISLLVEDEWQGRGVGTAMIRHLAMVARAAGHREMIAWCLPGEPAFANAANGSGLPLSTRREDDMTRIALRVTTDPNAAQISTTRAK